MGSGRSYSGKVKHKGKDRLLPYTSPLANLTDAYSMNSTVAGETTQANTTQVVSNHTMNKRAKSKLNFYQNTKLGGRLNFTRLTNKGSKLRK